MRALCIIWIIVFWHSCDFFSESYEFFLRKHLSYLTDSVLASFTFMSGFFLSKYRFESSSEVYTFYNKRLQRFFIPLLLCSILFYVCGGYVTIFQLIFQMLGLSMFILPAPKTYWYFSMIILFYIITPVISKKRGYIYAALFYIILISLCNVIDKRIIVFYPFYIIGLKSNEMIQYCKVGNKTKYYIISYITLCCACIFMEYKWYFSILISFFGLIAIHHLSKYISGYIYISHYLTYISYASMFAYISHRLYFILLYDLMNESLLFLVIVLCLIFIISYYLQRLYDRLIKSL